MNDNADRIGPYELRGELGRGAMARVWRAYDPNLRREVAIKEPLFDPRLSQGVLDEMNRRFVKEARTAARLNHSGIVAIYAADIYDGNRPAIVMELVEGATLASILERTGKLDPTAALDALDQLLDAVEYAHERGVVHRDIKPDNIFVNGEGRVKLADFGIAHVDDGRTRATQVGAVLGTPGYMSPEQARGSSVDSRSDLFSIGVVAYEMLTGVNPFDSSGNSDTTALLYRIAHEPAPALPESACEGLSVDPRPAIMAALSKDPSARPQTAAAFRDMLHGAPDSAYKGMGASFSDASIGFAEGVAVQSSSGGEKADTRKWLPYLAVAGACVAVLAVVFAMATVGGGGGRGAVQASGVTATSTASQVEAAQLGSGSSSASSASAVEEKVYPAPVFDTAVASSVLPADDTTAYYGPMNVLDNNFFTAWNEGAPGAGDWQWIELRSENPQHVKSVSIAAGYNKSDEVYYNNSRPCDIELSFSDGTIKPAHLEDKRGEYQEIMLDAPVDTTFIRVLILTTYPGSTYDDCCISDIEVK